MNKKVVHYVKGQGIIGRVGDESQIIAVDHPGFKPNSKITTSVVEAVLSNGVFETANTIYQPLEQLNG